MRLTDADRLEKEMNDLCCGECEVCGLSDCPAHSQPTAYDVGKIVEQIRKETDEHGFVDYINNKPVITKEKAIEIVKAGGINENR